MSVLLFEDYSTVGGCITVMDINGQGAVALLKPGEPLRIRGSFGAQNPKEHPTNTVQIILFLEDRFLKCVYNNVPPKEPDVYKGSFTFSCTVPELEGRYLIRAGYGFNWPWPEDAYKFLLANPQRIETVGELAVGAYAEKGISLVPLIMLAIPGVIFLGLGARSGARSGANPRTLRWNETRHRCPVTGKETIMLIGEVCMNCGQAAGKRREKR